MDNLFKENWFVFDETEGAQVESSENTNDKTPDTKEAAEKKATEKKEEGKAEVQVEATTDRDKEKAKLETVKSLASLKESMKESTDDLKKLDDFINSVNIGRLSITADEYFNDGIKVKIKEKIINKDISTVKPVLEKLFDLSASNPKEFLSNLVSEALAPKVKEKLDSVKDWAPFKSEEVKMFVKIEKGGETISLDCSKPTEYQKFLDDQTEAQKQAKTDEKNAEAQKSTADKQSEIEKSISDHPFGPFILGFISGKPEDGSDSTLTKLAKGTSPVWSFILGLLGVKGKQFKGAYDKAKEMAAKNPKSKSMFDQIETAVKGFVPEDTDKKEGGADSTETAANYRSTTKAAFGKLIDSKTERFPTDGIQLSELYTIKEEEGLKVTGGEVIVDGGDTIYYKKGKGLPTLTKTAESGKTESIKEDPIILVGALPKKTVIKAISVKTVDV